MNKKPAFNTTSFKQSLGQDKAKPTEIFSKLNKKKEKEDEDYLKQKNEKKYEGEKEKIMEEEEEVEADPDINFERIAHVNSARPQTSYGGISDRKRSLQKSLRQQSSKIFNRNNFNINPISNNPFNMLSSNRLSEMMKNDFKN